MATTAIHYTPATQVTGKANAAVKAGTFVVIAAAPDGRNPVIAPAGADAHAFGVAAHDCDADGYVTVYRTGVYEVSANAGIVAGDAVSTAASGKAKKAESGPVVAVAVSKTEAGSALVALK